MAKYIVLLAALSLTADAFAMRCGNKVISRGDHLIKVLDACGKPAYREHWVERRVFFVLSHRRHAGVQDVTPVEVSLWTYNFGHLRFMQELRFENGRLVRIKTLGYGF